MSNSPKWSILIHNFQNVLIWFDFVQNGSNGPKKIKKVQNGPIFSPKMVQYGPIYLNLFHKMTTVGVTAVGATALGVTAVRNNLKL